MTNKLQNSLLSKYTDGRWILEGDKFMEEKAIARN